MYIIECVANFVGVFRVRDCLPFKLRTLLIHCPGSSVSNIRQLESQQTEVSCEREGLRVRNRYVVIKVGNVILCLGLFYHSNRLSDRRETTQKNTSYNR